jgi:outer membrane protein OmpA-like peptidoglycan-associated protein
MTLHAPSWRPPILAVLACLVLARCGLPANVVVLVPDDDGKIGRAMITGSGATVDLNGSFAAVQTTPGQKLGAAFVADQQDVARAFASTVAAKPRAPAVFTLYFIAGQAELDPKSKPEIANVIAAAKATANADISVVGHADATGGDDINQIISRRRAQVVRDALVAGGVDPALIVIEYHGANNPRIKTAPGVPEPLNRRVEVTIR